MYANRVPSKKEIPMRIAEIASTRSKFENKKVGACIVDAEYRILGYGYNGYPLLKCGHNERYESLKNNHLYECCAAQNAIHFSTGSVRGATLYLTAIPCEHCAKAIVQAGIEKLIYLRGNYEIPFQNNDVSEEILKGSLGDNLMSFDQLMGIQQQQQPPQ